MLKVIENRSLLRSKESAVLNINQANGLISVMAIELKPQSVSRLRALADLTKSVFDEAHFVETFKGELIKIANYNVYKKTIKFARKFFNEESKKKYVLVTEDISESENEEEKEIKTELRIFSGNILILKIKFSSSSPIKFEILKNETSFEDLFKYYQDKMQFGEEEKTIEAQNKLQDIINFGKEAIEEVKNFYEEFVKEFSINPKAKYSWYSLECHDLKDI